MGKNLSTSKKEILRDAYTERLLLVCYELVKRKALARKQDFSQALGFNNHTQFNAIENRIANFPPKKAAPAEANLLSTWGINPQYLQGKDAKMFIWDPPEVKMAIGEDAAMLNFRDKRAKQSLIEENEALKARIIQLEQQLSESQSYGIAAEPPPPAYNSDNNPDKTT